MKHNWLQWKNDEEWRCDQCGIGVLSRAEPREDGALVLISLKTNTGNGGIIWVQRRLEADCNKALVREIMQL